MHHTVMLYREKFDLKYKHPTEKEIGKKTRLDKLVIEIECATSMLNNKVRITATSSQGYEWSKPIVLKDPITFVHPNEDKLTLDWEVFKLSLVPLQEENSPIYITCKEEEGEWIQ
ncbi:hypothetical protein K6119_02230 [Paracrocinitomix mangrovi]|uniref:hypothetical protein n=1 Tax=Paracrocinitomix mangrovi TaxID=2862509 RepID=UPI001C8E01F1|nr:hypothetical protein [Paracrocinitomix mangrovi]UKN02337.1 hypothetical protein K6119_02230 [Paracrocinitomix mangrovi]